MHQSVHNRSRTDHPWSFPALLWYRWCAAGGISGISLTGTRLSGQPPAGV